MATPTLKISDFFNPISNPAGGFNVKTTTPAVLPQKKKTATPSSALSTLYAGGGISLPPNSPLAGIGDKLMIGADGRVVAKPTSSAPSPSPSAAPVPLPSSGSRSGSGSPLPVPPGESGVAPASQAPVPAGWQKEDGSYKSADEIAADIAATLRGTQGGPDVGKLSGAQFMPDGMTTEEARTQARRIGNIRNDIAVGEEDPYGVASKSGIAYTPAELSAIEKAYAGIYDPALDSALSKVETKQAADEAAAAAAADERKMRLQAELDASAPYTLGKDQVRYDGQGNPIAVGLSDSDTMPSSYVAGANPTVDAFVSGIRKGDYKASDVPDEYKALVAQGLAATRPAISQASTEAASVIDQILAADDLGAITGVPGVSAFWPGSQAQQTMALTRQLAGMLSLDNREQLKGSGAISDFEFRVLRDAASALGINESGRSPLSEEAFKAELQKMQLKLLVGETELTDDELLYLHNEKGYSPEEIRALSGPQAFNSVGNTTASTGNRPQRNNNPGNVKAGGLADGLAVGTDDQGHLVFRSPQDGFKALQMDLTAKLNGSSRYLPANPTIAQLGKVYAEDSNWPNSVARMLGVSPNTPTQSVPFQKLVQAIATQEGFYA
jgi:hypothetical protein